MDDDYSKPRDLDSDLVEITSRLGEPDSAHRTLNSSVAWRLVLGVLIVVTAGVFHYLMWTRALPWPRAGHVKLWIIILGAMFIGPGFGIYLITFAIRGLKFWALAYPTGLFVWHRGRVVAFPWGEIRAVQFSGLPDKAALHGAEAGSDAVWYDLSRCGRRLLGTTLTLTRADGEQVGLPSTLGDFDALGRRVQEETFRRLFPIFWDQFQAGEPVEFGPVVCSPDGVTIGKETLPWNEVESLERAGDKLEMKRVGKKKKTVAKCDFNDLSNPHVLMGLAAAARSV